MIESTEENFTVECNVCKQWLDNWVGSTPCWGLITVIKNYDKVTQTYTLAQLLLYNV